MKTKPLKVNNTQSIKITTLPIYNPKAPMISNSPILNAKLHYFMKENGKRIQTPQSESSNLSSAVKYIQIKNNITQNVKNKIDNFYSICSESSASSQMLGSQILGSLSVKNSNKQNHEVRKLQEQVDLLNSEVLELRKSTLCVRCQQNSNFLSQNNTQDQMKIEEKLRQSTTQIESIAMQLKNISDGNLAISSICSQIGKNQPNNQNIYVDQVFELQSQLKGMNILQIELMEQKKDIQKQNRFLQQENQELKDLRSKSKVKEDEKEEKGTQTNVKTLIQKKTYDTLSAMDRINSVSDNLISKTRIII